MSRIRIIHRVRVLTERAARVVVASLAAVLIAGSLPAQSKVTTLSVDGRTGANPTIAAEGRFVAVAFSAATLSSMDIYVATSRDSGATFGIPVRVNAIEGQARVSGEEPPRIALVPRKGAMPEMVVVWTAKNGADWQLLSARSSDFGETFGSASAVPGSEGAGSRGWESVAVDRHGRVHVLWLDHRGTVPTAATHTHAPTGSATPAAPMPKADPTERAKLSQLMFASLEGREAVTITNSVCYCCKTSMAMVGDNVYAVWRHVYPNSMRDMAFSVSRNGGRSFSEPVRVSEDQWQLDGCPDNGPALVVDKSQRTHVVWPTAADGKTASALSIFYAVSSDNRRFTPRVRVPSRGPASHPQIVLTDDGTTIVAWDEIVEGTRRLGMTRARVNAVGVVTLTPVPPPDAGAGQWYPALAASGSQVFATWVRQLEKGSVVAVARLR